MSKETDSPGPVDAQYFCFDRYDDVSTILKDGRFGMPGPPSEVHRLLRLLGLGALARSAEAGFLTSLDPPAHSRLRGIVEPFFQKQAVASMASRVESIVEQLIDEVDGTGTFDLVADFSARLPSFVIAEMFGFPAAENERLSRWANRIGPLVDRELRRSALVPGLIAAFRLRHRFLQAVRDRRAHPQEDMLSALSDAYYGQRISKDELVGLAVFVFTAGQITVVDLISSCIMELAGSPALRAAIIERPDAIERLMEEALRLQSPIQRTARVATEDIEMNGQTIPHGSPLRLMLGVANRDHGRFRQPDVIDLERPVSRHLAFGAGRHFCIGLHLARLEVRIAIAALLRRFPELRLVSDEPSWRAGTKFRGLSELWIRTGARSGTA